MISSRKSVPREACSDTGLYDRLRGPAFGGETNGVEDDHLPFLLNGVPSVDLIDFTYGSDTTPGPYWHTAKDSLAHVCPASLGQVGRAVTGALVGEGDTAETPPAPNPGAIAKQVEK